MGLKQQAKEAGQEHVKQKAARDILNAIKEWRSNRILTAKRRWVFELIQNGLDTAKARKKRGLKIEIIEDCASLIFRHNGGFFTLDEISAVIYGGSTKPYSTESEYMGRFGTGFLVSSLGNNLSKSLSPNKTKQVAVIRIQVIKMHWDLFNLFLRRHTSYTHHNSKSQLKRLHTGQGRSNLLF